MSDEYVSQPLTADEEKRQRLLAFWAKMEDPDFARLQRRRLFDNIRLFLETEGLYVYDPKGAISSQELYALYRSWCIREKIPLRPPREFWLYLKANAPYYQLTYSGNLPQENGKRCRGFRGIRAIDPNTDDAHNP